MLDLPIEKRIGVSTHLMPSIHDEDIFRALDLTRDAGFSGIEIVPSEDQGHMGYPHNANDVGIDLWDVSAPRLAKLLELLQAFDWITIHAPHLDWNLASANRHFRRLTWEYYDRCFEFAIEAGAVAVTFHDGYCTPGFLESKEAIRERNCDYALHLIEKAKQFNVAVGFEVGEIGLLKYVCDQVEGWGINFDIGHAYIHGHTDEGFFAYIDELGSKIVEVHHNSVCHFWQGFLDHLPVHLNNTIDYQKTYERLKSIDCRVPIVCEIMGPDIKKALLHCQDAKEMICDIWNGTINLKERWNIQ